MGQDKKKCKLCGEDTTTGYNINMKLVPICDWCGNSIFMQKSSWLGKNEWNNIKDRQNETKTDS